jgi:hypothetical protein
MPLACALFPLAACGVVFMDYIAQVVDRKGSDRKFSAYIQEALTL